MRIAVLGPLEVRTDDTVPVAVPGAKERLLLALLAAGAPGVVTTDALVEHLWDGDPPPSARKSLQAHVVRLRSALEPGRPRGSSGRYIVRRGPGYALAVDRRDIDALHVADLTARGRAVLAAGHVAQAEELLGAAVALWRGEPYADWPEAAFAESERPRLDEVRSAATAGFLEARLALGRHADVLPELRRLVEEQPLHEEWWRLLVLALYRAGRQSEALAAGRRVRALLADELGVEPGAALRAMEAAVLTHDAALDRIPERDVGAPPTPTGPGACPYKGLAAYQPGDADLFHGRERLVAGLVARLIGARLLVLSGPSGSGKSSVVRAGLVPALRRGALLGSERWRSVLLTMGPQPVDLLAELTGEEPPDAPALLVCDQLEQLWAPGTAPEEWTAFLDAVLGLLDDGIVVRCIAVVRGDHLGRLAEHAELTDRLAGAIVLVPPMTDRELRAVVREPAAAVGLTVEPELVDVVVDDVLGRSGALPLLSTALVGTWERRRGDRLTLAGYLEAGGVAGALTRAAEEAYAVLGERGRALARSLLVRLADTNESGAYVRRAVPLTELGTTGDATRRVVLETFVSRRLLDVDADRVEVAHESLFTAWPRLTGWLADDATGRAVRRHLAPAARDWDARSRPTDELYRGARLTAALEWAAGGGDPAPLEREFLDASRSRAEGELREARVQVARERRARRRTGRLAAGLAAVLVVALIATVLTVRYQRAADARAAEAERESLAADAGRLAAIARSVGMQDVSLLLAAQAVRLADTPESEDALLGELLPLQRAQRIAPVVTEEAGDTTLGGGETLFVNGFNVAEWPVATPARRERGPQRVGGWGGWTVADGSPTEDLLAAAGTDLYDHWWLRVLRPDGSSRSLVEGGASVEHPIGITFDGTGRHVDVLLATGSDREASWSVREFDTTGGEPRDLGIGGTLPVAAGALVADVSDDGRTAVVSAPSDASVPPVLVDLAGGLQIPLRVPERAAAVTGFRALDSAVVEMWADGAVTVYGTDGRPVPPELGAGPDPVLDVVAAPDGTWAATVGGGGRITLWDIDTVTGEWTRRESFIGHNGNILNAEVTADGRRLVTVGADDRVVVWDATRGGGLGAPVAAWGDRWLAGRPQVVQPGRLLVVPTRPVDPAAADEQTSPGTSAVALTFLDPRTGRIVDEVAVGDIDAGRLQDAPSMAVSPDGRRLAVTTGLTTTVLDTRTRRPTGRPFQLPPRGDVGSDGVPLPAAFVMCLSWIPGSSRLVVCTSDEPGGQPSASLVAVDPATGREGRQTPVGGILDALAISPDDRVLAMSALRHGVHDARTEVLLGDVAGVPGDYDYDYDFADVDAATDMSFSRDGRWLALTGRSGNLYLIDLATQEHRTRRIVSGAALLQAEWLPDDRTVALAASDGTVALFDAERDQLRVPPTPVANDGRPAHVHLLPVTGDELVALSGERAGRRWPLDPVVWVRQACAVVGRDLTREEWSRYLPDRTYRPTCTDLDQHG